jgi:hypothetical protein
MPLGYLRRRVPKLSWQWFLYIHLAIPVIIALRLMAGLPFRVAPLMVAAAVAGQVLGARLRVPRE